MQSALVVGTATATVKHATLRGCKLLVVQPLLSDGRSPDGDPLLVADPLGAGRGQTVVITNDGRAAQELLGDQTTPLRWTTVGIVDS